MALNQKSLKEKLDEWAQVGTKIAKVTKRRNAELDPFIREHHEKTKPIAAKYAQELEPLEAKQKALGEEIKALLMANTDQNGAVKPAVVKSEKAVAQLTRGEGSRVVSVKRFFETVENKTESFWDCLSVLIGKAEKLLGKDKIDEISEKKTTYSVTIQTNQ